MNLCWNHGPGTYRKRNPIAVKRTTSDKLKLIYPHGEFTKKDVSEVLKYAIETHRRVKEQLKKIGGMEFYVVMYSYIDKETFEGIMCMWWQVIPR